jgi:polyferredoxin
VKKKIRKGQPGGPWVTARKAVQYTALVIFLSLFVGARGSGWSANILNLVMRLDPLVMLSNLFASRIFLASSALALIVILLTLIFGRVWCGWLCPLGTVLDLFSLKRWRGKRVAPSEGWRGIKYGLLLVILIAALLGNLTLLVLDPLTILYRSMTVSMWPALDRIITAIEMTLYQVSYLSGPVAVFDAWLRPRILPADPVYYRGAILFAAIFLGVIALNLWAPRFWCRYLCPLGGFLGLLSKPALFQRKVSQECKGCNLCSSVCPTGTINPAQGYVSDPGECTMCLDCLEVCPRSRIAFRPQISKAVWQEYDPRRRDALLAAGGAILGVALLRVDSLNRREPPFLLRPPGMREVNADILDLTRCIRCSECMRACPTGALQPAIFEAGLGGFATPLLAPRLGYCDYSCNACGQICPVQAIPPLTLEEKRLAVIGKAAIDQNRCIPWSEHLPCIVCEEMCPLPEKAIQLEQVEVTGIDGMPVSLQLPHVLRERCIGCGICEYKCPANGQAAIRIYNAMI